MKTLKIKDKIAALRRAYPNLDPEARYLYSGRLRSNETAARVAVHILAWSEDGRVTLHRTEFHKSVKTVAEWAEWLSNHAGSIINNQVRNYMNRTFGSKWYIERIFGWHIVPEEVVSDTEPDFD